MQAEVEPVSDLKVPAGQGEHGPAAGPKKPAAQLQFEGEVLPAGAWKLRGQGMQAPEKTVDSPVVIE